MDRATVLKTIFFLCLMKMCNKIVEMQFGVQDPGYFWLENGTEHGGKGAACHLNPSAQPAFTQSSVTTWIYTTRYLLPVLGGLLSSAWLGYARVLQIGGYIMLLSTVLMSVSVNFGLLCQPTSPIIPFTWLLLPLFFGVTQPNILHGMLRWLTEQKHSTMVSAIYYTVAASGELITRLISTIKNNEKPFAIVCITLSGLFIVLSLLLPSEPAAEPFELPTRSRMIRYFQIFSGLVLFLASVSDTRSTMYNAEMAFYFNETNSRTGGLWLSPDWLILLSLIIISPLLMLIAFIRPRQLPIQPRMQTGILLEAAVALCLTIFTAVGTSSHTATVAVYSVASILDAIAEALVMVAAYDLGNAIAPSNSKAFVMGIMFTVWGLSNIASRLLLLILSTFPRSNPVLHPGAGVQPHFYAYHLTALGALIVCSVYHRFVAFPLAIPLILTGDSDPEEPDETQPLLDAAF